MKKKFLSKIFRKFFVYPPIRFWNLDKNRMVYEKKKIISIFIPLNEMYVQIDKNNRHKKIFHPQEDPIIRLYFCTNQQCVIGTKVLHYYGFAWSHRQILRRFFLSVWAYISFNGIKYQKFWREFFHFVIPPHIDFSKNRPKSKVHFCWTFFKKTKCTYLGTINLKWQVSSS